MVKFVPREYQKLCLDHLEKTPKAGLFLDCGLGKTVVTLTYIWSLLYDEFRDDVHKVLVIAPKRVAEDTWTNEQLKWDHLKDLRFSRIVGTQKQRLKALEVDADVYTIGRDNLDWLINGFGKKWPFDMIVADELSSFKSPKASRFRSLKKVMNSGKVNYFVGLTATPQPNGLKNLWSQIYLIDKGERLGKTLKQYHNQYFYEVKHFNHKTNREYTDYIPLATAEDQIHDKLKDIVISLKGNEWVDVPEATYIYHEIKLNRKEKSLVNNLIHDKVIEFEESGTSIEAANAGQVSRMLLQMANGAIYDKEHNVQVIHDRKLDALEDLVESANGAPVMVFYWFKHDQQRILERFKKYNIRISDLKKAEDRADWNKGLIDMALVHPASVGHGLNLQDGGNIIIWFSMLDDLELYIQANARLNRQGQKQRVLIHHLVTLGTHDEDAIMNLQNKEQSQQRLIEALKARLSLET